VTSLLAWIAVDKRRPTGLYFASDSRRSWKDRDEIRDDCIKLFLPSGTREIFGFAGDITFPSKVLTRICSELESDPELVNGTEDPYNRYCCVLAKLKAEFDALTSKPEHEFTILHGTRVGAMYKASFHLFQYTYDFASGQLSSGSLSCEAGSSVMVSRQGSGGIIVKSFLEKETAKLGEVSRAHFSAFCNAVDSGQDKCTGGPIQLAGVHSIKDSLHYGVVTPNGTYYRGSTQLPANVSGIRWRNREFAKVDSLGNVLPR